MALKQYTGCLECEQYCIVPKKPGYMHASVIYADASAGPLVPPWSSPLRN